MSIKNEFAVKNHLDAFTSRKNRQPDHGAAGFLTVYKIPLSPVNRYERSKVPAEIALAKFIFMIYTGIRQ